MINEIGAPGFDHVPLDGHVGHGRWTRSPRAEVLTFLADERVRSDAETIPDAPWTRIAPAVHWTDRPCSGWCTAQLGTASAERKDDLEHGGPRPRPRMPTRVATRQLAGCGRQEYRIEESLGILGEAEQLLAAATPSSTRAPAAAHAGQGSASAAGRRRPGARRRRQDRVTGTSERTGSTTAGRWCRS